MKGETLTMDGMILCRPDESLLTAVAAYRKEFENDLTKIGGGGCMRQEADPVKWLAKCRSFEQRETCPAELVPATQYVYVRKRDGKIVGVLQLRHELNDYLLQFAGHIGYSVCPSERRKGYAKAMLHDALDEARKLGLTRVLITCGDWNEGSRRTILANGGVLESKAYEPDDQEWLERYWIQL